MKFEEKLMKLRKEKVLSQEELAEKLNVTRQTISKWELGQSKPDMDKLQEMSTLFEVPIENLVNDTMDIEKNSVETKKPRKSVLYIFVGLVVALIITLVVVSFGGKKEEPKQEEGNIISSFFDEFFGVIEKGIEMTDKVNDKIDGEFEDNANQMQQQFEDKTNQMQQQFQDTVNQMTQNYDKETFNKTFEINVGTKATIFVKSTLDEVNKNNKKNTGHIVSVVYNDKITTNEADIIQIKHSLEEWGEYEVSVDYDETGYVNKVTIQDIKK